MKAAVEWHLAEIERLRGIKIKSRQIRRRILFHEISAKELEAFNTRTVSTVEGLETFDLLTEGRYDFDGTYLYPETYLAAAKNGEWVKQSEAVAVIAKQAAEIKECHDNINLKADFIEKTIDQLRGEEERAIAAEADNAPLTSRLMELEEYARKATQVITGLSGGGSENFRKPIGEVYPADLQFCAERIRDRHVSKLELKRLEALLEASEKARDDAITHRLKANNDWRVAYEKLEAALAGTYGISTFVKSSRFALEFLSGARPPVHPEPMVGKHTFDTFKEAIDYMSRRANDSQLTGLIEHTIFRAETNRTVEAQEVLQKLRAQYDDFSTDPMRWSWSKLIRERPNGLRAVFDEYNRRLAE